MRKTKKHSLLFWLIVQQALTCVKDRDFMLLCALERRVIGADAWPLYLLMYFFELACVQS
jgi:hypothetical protein